MLLLVKSISKWNIFGSQEIRLFHYANDGEKTAFNCSISVSMRLKTFNYRQCQSKLKRKCSSFPVTLHVFKPSVTWQWTALCISWSTKIYLWWAVNRTHFGYSQSLLWTIWKFLMEAWVTLPLKLSTWDADSSFHTGVLLWSSIRFSVLLFWCLINKPSHSCKQSRENHLKASQVFYALASCESGHEQTWAVWIQYW